MKIRIDNFSVNGLGPISSIKWMLKDINLIYGKNEQGKTFIVEYLLNSLFRNAPKPRKLTDSGHINVSGLGEKQIRFDPSSRKKLEDYIFPDDHPVDLSRLLVVKAGQTKFSSINEKGIDKNILKDYLSDQRTLDAIMSRIPANIQRSSWENGQLITGINTGESKKYSSLLNQLRKADELLVDVDEKFALGEIRTEKIRLDEINALIEEQENARRYCAYQRSAELEIIEEQIEQLPQKDLDEIKKVQNQIQSLQKLINKDQNELNILEPQCAHYDWLETAINECENRKSGQKVKSELIFIPMVILLITAALAFAFLQILWGYLITGLLAILFFILTILHYRSRLLNSDETAEVDRIFQAYEIKFGEKAHAITDLKSKYSQLQPKFYGLRNTKDQLKGNNEELIDLQEYLLTKLNKIIGKKPDLDKVDTAVHDLQKKRDILEENQKKIEVELAGLGVEPIDYLAETISTPFERKRLASLLAQKDVLNQSIQEKEGALQVLKQRVCDLTDKKISSSWDELIESFRYYRDDVSQLMKETKATIGSGIVVTQIIEETMEREDEGITKALASNEICEPIKALTHSYQGIDMEGDELIVFNEFDRFPLHDLSTGAQEQILLALRIGIAAHFLKSNKMFLILDDAFQHSDWQRREWLVDQMAELASIGWQIIYFAMDNHIKELFENRVEPKFKDRFAKFELTN